MLLKIRNLSISKKFTVSLLLLLILPLIFLFLCIQVSVAKHIENQTYETNLQVLKQTKTPIHYMLQDLSYVSIGILGNEEIQEYLSPSLQWDGEIGDRLAASVRYEINQLLSGRNWISRISIFDEEEIYFQFGGYLLEEDTTDLLDVKSKQGKSVWLPTQLEEEYISKSDRIYEIPVVRGIINMKTLKDTIGYERINVKESYLCSLYQGLVTANTKELFIVNGKGQVVSSWNKQLLDTNIGTEDYFTTIIQNKEGYLKENKNQIISYYSIDNPEWYVIKIEEKQGMIGGTILKTIILVCMIMVVVFGICFYFIQRRQIIQPIQKLSKEVSKFHEGQYTLSMHTDAKDEIGELNKSFVEMGNYIQDLIERVYKSQLKEKEAQLRTLQAQINPHFLYNTLDSMRWMAIKEKQMELAKQIEALSNLFRHALNQGKEMTTIHSEVQYLRDYLTIQKNKFGERLQVTIEVEAVIEQEPVLNLILQPLVENSILHGFGDKLGECWIKITVTQVKDCIRFVVEDNGVGTDEKEIQKKLKAEEDPSDTLALRNINERLRCKYGEQYKLQFESEIGVGTRVEIKIPKGGE